MKFQKLFWDPHFDDILTALEGAGPKGNPQDDFKDAMAKCNWITAEEVNWLWNYLKNYKKKGTGGEGHWELPNVLEAAAGTGW